MKKYKSYVLVTFAYICVRSRTFAYVVVTIRTFFTETYANVLYAIASLKYNSIPVVVCKAVRNVIRLEKILYVLSNKGLCSF